MNSEKPLHNLFDFGKRHVVIDITDFNRWGLPLINSVMLGYLNEADESASSRYLHSVLSTFVVEDFNDDPAAKLFRHNLLTNDYVKGFNNYKSEDFQNKLQYLHHEYSKTLRDLVSQYTPIAPSMMYTAVFDKNNYMLINLISDTVLEQSVVEIF